VAKEIFMTQWFSDQMLLAGESLIKRLDKSAAKVQAAFWLLDAEDKNWKLTIVSPLVESEGPRNYYRRINDINESAKPDEEVIALHDISVSNTDNRIVKAIKRSVLGNSILGNNRLGKNTLGGVYIEDMYLYRIDWKLLGDNTLNTTTADKTLPLSP
jgi:ABC-type molybdenum transport system ATPase subunit/photorepair protein PhrA